MPLSVDYKDITIPVNIAPLYFSLDDSVNARIHSVHYRVGSCLVKSGAKISKGKWRKLLQRAAGDSMDIMIIAESGNRLLKYDPFRIHVTEDKIDPYLAYRLIEPGYELWNEMGIYQRDLESFHQSSIIENKSIDYGCVNCHSFASYDPGKFLFHARMSCGGTYVLNDGNIEKLNTKTDETVSALVYPQWHPSGDYVAFSVNKTNQRFHFSSANRVEVFDHCSDVVIYDMNRHEIFSCPWLKGTGRFETFPTFSPAGDRIYFCCADSLPLPDKFEEVRYSLCSIAFDAETRTFGDEVHVHYDASHPDAGSVSFPRVSPDGKKVMFTLSGYGNFSIWHKDADLYLLDLSDDSCRELKEINSDDVESYHSWSGNGKWIVFSSRRDDGLYTRLYFSHVDDSGNFSKPFVLPQISADYYDGFMKSYNIPEFISGPVKNRKFALSRVARGSDGIAITFSK